MTRDVSPPNLLAKSLTAWRDAVPDASVAKAGALSRTHLDRLLDNGFLERIVPGWVAYNPRPGTRSRVRDEWSTVFWEFLSRYAEERFGSDWCLGPEASVAYLAGNRSIRPQVVVHAAGAGNDKLDLPGSTSVFFLRSPVPGQVVETSGIRAMDAEEALARLAPKSWQSMATDVVAVLGGVRSSSSLLRPLLAQGRTVAAGRLAGALRKMDRPEDAKRILTTMRSLGHDVREVDPFADLAVPPSVKGLAPAAGRIAAMWTKMRQGVLDGFPTPPPGVVDKASYMGQVEEIFVSDAYNSLSIEGYQVTPELIEKVAAGSRDPDGDPRDLDTVNALATRGYWLAFQAVKADVAEVLDGAPTGDLLRDRHQDWFREMFTPSVAAGIMKPHDLAGYRHHPIYLRGSSHVPTPHEWIPDAMDVLFDCVAEEDDPRVKAVLAPFLFTYVHPFTDGNGRTARFVMNACLAEGGYPWTVVPYGRRDEYLACLEAASRDEDALPLSRFVHEAVVAPPPPRPRRTAWSHGR